MPKAVGENKEDFKVISVQFISEDEKIQDKENHILTFILRLLLMQGNSPVVTKDLIDTMMTLNAGIATFPPTHVENSMMTLTAQPDLQKAPLKEEVKGVRGDVEDTTDVGEKDQVDMEVVEGQEDMEVVEGQEEIKVIEGQKEVKVVLQDSRKVGNNINGAQQIEDLKWFKWE